MVKQSGITVEVHGTASLLFLLLCFVAVAWLTDGWLETKKRGTRVANSTFGVKSVD